MKSPEKPPNPALNENVNPNLSLEIDGIAFGGKGIGRQDGKVFFVLDAVPGDQVVVKVTSDKGRYGEAEIVSTLVASPLRGPSPCPVSTRCGGCQWIDIPYQNQLLWKQSFVESSLQRIGKIPPSAMLPIIGSPEQLHYRNRVHLKGLLQEDGSTKIGYFRRGSRDLVPITACQIAHASINTMIDHLNHFQPANAGSSPFKLEIQQLPAASLGGASSNDASEPRDLLVTVFQDELSNDTCKELVAWILRHRRTFWAGTSDDRQRCEATTFEVTEGIRYFALPGQFQQVNTAANLALRRSVASKIAKLSPRSILDVFCGSGNLSLGAASADTAVDGVESNPAAIASAKKNVEVNAKPTANYFRGDGEAHLWKCAKKGVSYDLVLVDPPREGMYRALVPLKKMAPKDILYISCDPSTLARDIGALCRSTYEVVDIQTFDFFPNTFHVEAMVHLRLVPPK